MTMTVRNRIVVVGASGPVGGYSENEDGIYTASCKGFLRMKANLKVDVFKGREASVNSYLFSNDKCLGVIDALRNQLEAVELAETIKSSGKTLQWIYVSHGHPDHYIGIRTLKEAFPSVRIWVASDLIKQDIVNFSGWMESVGWLDGQPQMKAKSTRNAEGFDYVGMIDILKVPQLSLDGGGVLDIRRDYPAAECAHPSTLHCEKLNVLFVSDFCYHGVHAWAGQGVEKEHIRNWIQVLGDLKAEYFGTGATVYPGHGEPGGVELFDTMRTYLEDFLSAIQSGRTNREILERMRKIYPTHAEADFLLHHSVLYHGPDSKSAAVVEQA